MYVYSMNTQVLVNNMFNLTSDWNDILKDEVFGR